MFQEFKRRKKRRKTKNDRLNLEYEKRNKSKHSLAIEVQRRIWWSHHMRTHTHTQLPSFLHLWNFVVCITRKTKCTENTFPVCGSLPYCVNVAESDREREKGKRRYAPHNFNVHFVPHKSICKQHVLSCNKNYRCVKACVCWLFSIFIFFYSLNLNSSSQFVYESITHTLYARRMCDAVHV